jgi:hypothetical protein
VTPNIGAATATSINGNAITTGTGTFTIDGALTLRYKSGTWSPTFNGYTIVGGSASSTATYVRVGKLVTVNVAFISGTSSASTAGGSWISGMPYTVSRASSLVGAANTGNGISFGSGYANGGNGIFTPTWGATSSVVVSCTYETDDA